LLLIVSTKEPITADKIRAARKISPSREQHRYEETRVGGHTVYEETWVYSWDLDRGDAKDDDASKDTPRSKREPKRRRGDSLCVADEHTLLLAPNLDSIRTVLERGGPAKQSDSMKAALAQLQSAPSAALAVDVSRFAENHRAMAELTRGAGPLFGEGSKAPQLMSKITSLTLVGDLGESTANVRASLTASDAETAKSTAQTLDGMKDLLMGLLKTLDGAPAEAIQGLGQFKPTAAGSQVSAELSIPVEPVVAWIKVTADRQRQADEQRRREFDKVKRDAKRVRDKEFSDEP
jgi:hypothetical protein